MVSAKIHARTAAVIDTDNGILNCFGMTVLKAWEGECEIQAVVPQAMINGAGFAHGSIAFSLLDTACAYAISSLEMRGVTINANVSYIKGAVEGSRLLAKVSVVSHTRRVVTLRGEVLLNDEVAARLAAHGSFVFQLIEG